MEELSPFFLGTEWKAFSNHNTPTNAHNCHLNPPVKKNTCLRVMPLPAMSLKKLKKYLSSVVLERGCSGLNHTKNFLLHFLDSISADRAIKVSLVNPVPLLIGLTNIEINFHYCYIIQ